MFGKHALAAKILQEAKDQGITLVTARPIDDSQQNYSAGQECYHDVKIFDEVLLDVGKKTPREELRDMSITRIDKFTPMQREEYKERQNKLHLAAEKAARAEETTERAIAHLTMFDMTEQGLSAAMKYISSMMPKHYDISCDGMVEGYSLPSRYGIVQHMEFAIVNRKSGFSVAIFIYVIDGKVAVSSKQPRFIKQVFDFQLKQHLDYELRFKKRDQERFNANFAVGG